MSNRSTTPGPLVTAATAFEAELLRFGHLTETLTKLELDSEKQLERAAATLQELASSEERLGSFAQQLMGALTGARDEQQRQAVAVTEQAKVVEARSRAFQEVIERFQGLGEEAAALNRLGQEMSESAPQDRAGAERALLPRLDELSVRMTDLADKSQKLAEDAKAASFGELSRKAHELRQQLLAARNRVTLLQQRLTS